MGRMRRSLAGNVIVQGDDAATEGADAADFVGAISVQGSLALTDRPDSASIVGNVAVIGTVTILDIADTAALSGSVSDAVIVSGSLDAVEGADGLEARGPRKRRQRGGFIPETIGNGLGQIQPLLAVATGTRRDCWQRTMRLAIVHWRSARRHRAAGSRQRRSAI
jgi:hypothetical protein